MRWQNPVSHNNQKKGKRTNQIPHSKNEQPITAIAIIDFSYVNPDQKYTSLPPFQKHED